MRHNNFLVYNSSQYLQKVDYNLENAISILWTDMMQLNEAFCKYHDFPHCKLDWIGVAMHCELVPYDDCSSSLTHPNLWIMSSPQAKMILL